MIEVLTNYLSDDQTFFIAVSIMDRYFKNCEQSKGQDDLHGIGVTCMFIASKFEESVPFTMEQMYSDIAFKNIQKCKIKELELNIL